MRTLANTISFLFHPLLMITYGMLLALNFTYLDMYPQRMKLFVAFGTLLSTAIIPGLFILLMVRTGMASDVDLSDRKERSIPYMIIVTSVLLCIYYQFKMHMPFWLLAVLMGVCVALCLMLCINLFWKISAHAVGTGGLLGAVMGVARLHMSNPYWAFIGLVVIAGLVCTSRIYLKKHTPSQVYAGTCLGFICTFTASLLSYLYLFI